MCEERDAREVWRAGNYRTTGYWVRCRKGHRHRRGMGVLRGLCDECEGPVEFDGYEETYVGES